MTELKREHLSALMDGEAVPPASLDALLREPALKASWARYHLARDALHHELYIPAGDLASRINAALEAEPTVLAPVARKPRAVTGLLKQAASFAVAASVTAAVIFGVQGYHARQAGAPALAQQPAAAAPAPRVLEQPRLLPLAPLVQAASATNKPLDPRQERLRAYLLDHSEQAAARGGNGMLPYVRVVSQEPVER